MHYVILETKTEGGNVHELVLSEIGYQIIDSETLLPCDDPKFLNLVNETVTLNEAIDQLSNDINKYCNTKEKGIVTDAEQAPEKEKEKENEYENIVDKKFVFCTLDSNWDIRVSLVNSAAKQDVILPDYLRHPVIFDLRKEFSLWLINHPEIKNQEKNKEDPSEVSSSPKMLSNEMPLDSLEFIINSLDLKNEYDNQVEKKDSLQFQVAISRVILTELHKKCTTAEDELTVLTRPYDLSVDFYNFLDEKSKVLYVNNIPAETTQNDLENWFNSYSLNPVGFWTLRNITDNIFLKSQKNKSASSLSDNIFGFIIFQSHEDAKNGLKQHANIFYINNSKSNKSTEDLIEIQPSSIKLLEKVQDNLVQFPQNKNKPRPGDWNCPSCGFSNFQRRTACFRCSFPIPNTMSGNLNKYNGSISNSNNTNTNNSNIIKNYGGIYNQPTSPHLNWNKMNPTYQLNQQQKKQQQLQHLQQVQQTYQMYAANRASNNSPHSPINNNYRFNYNGSQNNNGMYNNANVYNKLNTNSSNSNTYGNISNVQGIYSNNMSNGVNMVNNTGNTNNLNNNNSMNGGSNVPFRAGDWKCTSCFYHNFAKNIVCLRCGGPKSEFKHNHLSAEKSSNNIEQSQIQHQNFNSNDFNTKKNNTNSSIQFGFNAAYPYLNVSSGSFSGDSSEQLQERQEVPVSNL